MCYSIAKLFLIIYYVILIANRPRRNIMPKLNPFIKDQPKISYAKETEDESFQIDCSAGCNPYGFSPSVRRALGTLTEDDSSFFDYPHGMELKRAIAEYWLPYACLDTENIQLCGGSIDGIYLSNLLFQRDGAEALGICPQFSDYVLNARLLGYKYRGINLTAEENYRFYADRLLNAIVPELSLIYIDNPNNPTGQVIAKSDMKLILEKAGEYDICVIADEAYGDYFPRGESAATLIRDFDNLIVLRTFSKGLGLAGIRAGYILTNRELRAQFDKISNPYVISQPSRILAQASLLDEEFLKECLATFAESKTAIRGCTGERLHMAHTLDACPIMLLWHSDTSADLALEFMRRGVKVYSGADFETLDKNSARLRVPEKKHLERLLPVIKEINGQRPV